MPASASIVLRVLFGGRCQDLVRWRSAGAERLGAAQQSSREGDGGPDEAEHGYGPLIEQSVVQNFAFDRDGEGRFIGAQVLPDRHDGEPVEALL